MSENEPVIIPISILDAAPTIGSTAFLVYAALSKYANRRTGESCPEVKRLARDTGLSVRAIQVSLKSLCAAGLLTATKRCRAATIYRLAELRDQQQAESAELYVVGRVPIAGEWKITAVCETRSRAAEYMVSRDDFIMGPIRLGQMIPPNVRVSFPVNDT